MEREPSGRVRVFAYAADTITQAGVASQLAARPDIEVVGAVEVDRAEVAVVVGDELDAETVQVVRAVQRGGVPRVIVVLGRLEEASMLAAIEAGACGILRRAEATPGRLAEAVLAAARGDGSIPPDLLGRLLDQVGKLQRHVLAPRGLSFRGFADREVAVLKLLAEGWDTAEIASQLCYSERTVKSVIHDMTTRLQLRNRAHVVAYALREGFI